MKTYVGERPADEEIGDCRVMVVRDDGRSSYPLPHVVIHSPTGFEWGYGGSGPADLALSILADLLQEPISRVLAAWRGSGHSRALDLHQHFKFAFIGGLDRKGWRLTEEVIRRWMDSQEKT